MVECGCCKSLQHYLLKGLFSHHWIIFALLLKINWNMYVYGWCWNFKLRPSMSWAMDYPFAGWKGIIHRDTGTILTSSQDLVHSWGRKLGGRLRPRLVLSWNGGKGKAGRCWERDIISFHSSDRNKRLKWKKYIFLKISPIHYFFFSTVQHGDPVTHTCIHSFFLTLPCSIVRRKIITEARNAFYFRALSFLLN